MLLSKTKSQPFFTLLVLSFFFAMVFSANADEKTLVAFAEHEQDHAEIHQHNQLKYFVQSQNQFLPAKGSESKLQDLLGQPVLQNSDGTVEAKTTARLTPSFSGAQKTVVLMVNFADNASEPFSQQQLKESLYYAPNSTNNFYVQQSNGAVFLTGSSTNVPDIYGWMQTSGNMASCDYKSLSQSARDTANQNGINLSPYNHVIILFPHSNACSWAGLASMPGNTIWLNGYINPKVITHEMGHNFGASHASSLFCTLKDSPQQTNLSSDCRTSEYGDRYDVMGSSESYMSAWHRWRIGQMPDQQMQTAGSSGTYSLVASNDFSNSSEARTVLIPRRIAGQPLTQYIALETRKKAGVFESFALDSPLYSGISIRLVGKPTSYENTLLVNTAASSQEEGFNKEPLMSGQTFVDPISKVSVYVNSVAEGKASLNIEVSPNTDTTPPSPPVLTGLTYSTSQAKITWSQAQDDEDVIAGYQIFRNGQLIATSTDLAFEDQRVSDLPSASYFVKSVDGAGNVSSPSNALTAVWIRRSNNMTPTPKPKTLPKPDVEGLKLVAKKQKKKVYYLVWKNHKGIQAYNIYKNGKKLVAVQRSPLPLKGFQARKKTEFAVSSVNSLGQEGNRSYLLYGSKNSKQIKMQGSYTKNGLTTLSKGRRVSFSLKGAKSLKAKIGSKAIGIGKDQVQIRLPKKAKPYFLKVIGKKRKNFLATFLVEADTIRPQ